MMVAGLERDVGGRAARIVAALAGVGERADLGVRFARALVPAFAEHAARPAR